MVPALVLLLIQGLDSFLLCFSQLLRCPHDIGASFSKSAQSTWAKEVSQCSLNDSPESHLPLLQLDTDSNSMWDTTDIHRLEYHQRRLFESYLRGHPPYESVDISNYFWELKKKKRKDENFFGMSLLEADCLIILQAQFKFLLWFHVYLRISVSLLWFFGVSRGYWSPGASASPKSYPQSYFSDYSLFGLSILFYLEAGSYVAQTRLALPV